MNSVTMVRKLRINRSPTLNQPQNRPNRSLISRAWPTPDYHFLVDDQHRDQQQQQRPQQGVAVVLAGLGVGGHAAGVVVADHHDQPGPGDGQECDQLAAEPAGLRRVDLDPAQRALDVTQVGLVQHRRGPGQLRPGRRVRRLCGLRGRWFRGRGRGGGLGIGLPAGCWLVPGGALGVLLALGHLSSP